MSRLQLDLSGQDIMTEDKITRREETASTRSLLNTVKLMENNPILLKLKELEYIERICEKVDKLTLIGGNNLLEQLSKTFISE